MNQPSWKKEITKLEAIASAWYQWQDADTHARDLAAEYVAAFPMLGNGDPSRQLKEFSRLGDKTEWHELDGYFQAPASVVRNDEHGRDPDVYWPLAKFSLRVSEDELELMLRLVLYRDDDGDVDAWGWRFDTADADLTDHSHPYSHVQHITTWEKAGYAFEPPGHARPTSATASYAAQWPKTTPESKPAIPIRCDCPAGLVVAAMLSLYGPRVTARILQGSTQADDQFRMLTGMDKAALIA